MNRKGWRQETHRAAYLAIALLSGALLVSIVLALLGSELYQVPHTRQQPAWRTDLSHQIPAAKDRKVYPYSVVSGGVYTQEEFQAAQHDAVVAAHYAGLKPKLTPVVLERDHYAYVSFRKNSSVYWTRRPVKLSRGERLLTDGENIVRARCGNRVSDIPRLPTAAEEPSEEIMDQGAVPPTSASAGHTPGSVPPALPQASLVGGAPGSTPVARVAPRAEAKQTNTTAPQTGPTSPSPAAQSSSQPAAGQPMQFIPPAGGYPGTPAFIDGPDVTQARPAAPEQPGTPPSYNYQAQPVISTPGEMPSLKPQPPGPATTTNHESPSPALPPQVSPKPVPIDNPKYPPSAPPPPPNRPPVTPPPPRSEPPVYVPVVVTPPERPVSVPEPGSLALLSVMLAAVWLGTRRIR